MRVYGKIWLFLFVGLLLGQSPTACIASIYYVSKTGSDTNSGAISSPWASIQKAATTMAAGDKVLVQPGVYDERISTTRGGNSQSNRITFSADGEVSMRGFSLNNPYITLDGFTFTGHSQPSNAKVGYVEVSSSASYFQIVNNTFRDGIAIRASDLVFTHNAPATNDTITSATGGFLNAGFKTGLTLSVYKAGKNVTPLNNARSLKISSVTDNTITLQLDQIVVSEGPVLAYLDCSVNYAVAVNAGAHDGGVISNRFTNLSFDVLWCGGETNLYACNKIDACNGWNVFEYFGHDNILRRNIIRDSPYSVYSPSPDVFENWSPQPAYRITFEENFVWNFDGALGVHHPNANAGTLGPLLFRRNVFANVSLFVDEFTNVTYLNNTFFQVTTGALALVATDAHPLECKSFPGSYSSEGVVIKNNVFVGCGDQTQSVSTHGWYSVAGLANYTTDFNFVAGAVPGYGAKVGFDEGHPGLNGGDPGFVNPSDPLGPDGIPFTDDDGLRLRSDSKLLGKGEAGVDIGAYISRPPISISVAGNGQLLLAWPAWADGFMLQSSGALGSAWSNVIAQPAMSGLTNTVLVNASEAAAFYRLVK